MNRFSSRSVISNFNRFANDDEKKKLSDVLPSAITEVITPEDILFFNSKGHISGRLADKVAKELVEKYGFEEEEIYSSSYPGTSNRRLKLWIERIVEGETFIPELESKGFYKSHEIDDMVKDAIRKLIDEDKFYGNDLTHVTGDVCIELNKIWDSKYGERPCGSDIKKIVEKYHSGGNSVFSSGDNTVKKLNADWIGYRKNDDEYTISTNNGESLKTKNLVIAGDLDEFTELDTGGKVYFVKKDGGGKLSIIANKTGVLVE